MAAINSRNLINRINSKTKTITNCERALSHIFWLAVAREDIGKSSDSFDVAVRTDIIWITPLEDPASGNIGPNMNFRWGYGVDGIIQPSASMIDKAKGKGTDPLTMQFVGENCEGGNPEVVDLDAGKSSLRYSSGEWQLNWQTGQSTILGGPLREGCYELFIPRTEGQGSADTKHILLSN